MSATFPALVLDEAAGKVSPSLKDLADSDLPEGDVTVAVEYSTLNYKDGLIINGLGKLVRKYPHVPGIDFAGTVESSANPAYKPGDKVVLTGWRVGEVHWGGFAGKARVKGDWLVPLPPALSTRHAMAIGTAGLTAMMSVIALEKHGLQPGSGEVLVTGGAGGVGSVAIAILSKLGHKVAASTGRAETHDYLKSLGATSIVDRAELATAPGRPLMAERWVGCVDTVGGAQLGHLLPSLAYNASVAVCGNAGGLDFQASVIPFLLRGINLLGMESAMRPFAERKEIWSRLATDVPLDKLDAMVVPASLKELPGLAKAILKGQVRGRAVVDVNK